jgi:hypothetical protein
LDSVKDFIETSLRSNLVGRDSVVVNWFGAEGLRLADHIMRQTLTVFEVPA